MEEFDANWLFVGSMACKWNIVPRARISICEVIRNIPDWLLYFPRLFRFLGRKLISNSAIAKSSSSFYEMRAIQLRPGIMKIFQSQIRFPKVSEEFWRPIVNDGCILTGKEPVGMHSLSRQASQSARRTSVSRGNDFLWEWTPRSKYDHIIQNNWNKNNFFNVLLRNIFQKNWSWFVSGGSTIQFRISKTPTRILLDEYEHIIDMVIWVIHAIFSQICNRIKILPRCRRQDVVTSLSNWETWSFISKRIIPAVRREAPVTGERNDYLRTWSVFETP
jgi:hypothetical protein